MRGLIGARTLAIRALAALTPLSATIALLCLPSGEAASAPAAIDAARAAAGDGAGEVADALLAARGAARSDARPNAKADVAAPAEASYRAQGYFADAERPIAPDPVPLQSDAFFVLTVTFRRGSITVDEIAREKLATKQAAVRRFGRFAAELYSGPTLVERVRFDFPLISDDDYASDMYARGLVTTVKVRIPDSDRPNKLEIWDRATDRRWRLEYPPRITR